MPNRNIEIRDTNVQPEDVQDIIGNPPSWMLRSGIGVVFFVVMMGLFLTGWISYPDTIQANIELTSETPPVDVLAIVNGQIDSIYIINGQDVKQGDTLIYIKNSANPTDIRKLEQFMDSFAKKSNGYSDLIFPQALETGTMSTIISRLSLKFKQLQDLSKDHTPLRKIKSLENEINKIRALNKVLYQESLIYAQEVQLQEKNYQRNITLYKAGVISESDSEKMKSTVLQYQRQQESMKSNIIRNKIKIEQLSAQIIEQKMHRNLQMKQELTELNELLEDVRNAINEWRLTYFVVAPMDGVVSVSGKLAQNSFIQSGQIVAGIIPPSAPNKILARGYVPISGIGKITAKNRAIIRLDAYPYKEFGTIETAIDHIALLPTQDEKRGAFYEFELFLPDPLKTNYEKIIAYQPKMTGTATLITKDRSLAERIFAQFLDLTKNR